ncbi:suppressor of fused domain protein [Chryseobacterium sp. MEBOG06]|uniref:suppressor of fused domain protein n=1 Tax=unclassified Chryseobacterium TaxID=2593645 RepID=UPI001F4686E5|nr:MULTISPECIES: suppressor of fused domain protein [unclassified Chryseobacterium]UKB85264.1 suppressor of fused domain protein [Chryseobacterium sp. MEBOG06]
MKITEHLEKYIGKISRRADIKNKRYNHTISFYDNIPFGGTRTYTTLGLNRYFTDYSIEFVLVCLSQYNENEIASFLTAFSEYLIDNKKGVQKGDVISFDFTMTSETQMDSLYFTFPFYFYDDLQQLELEDKSVIFLLIVPIYREEADLIREKGWDLFEEFMEEKTVDDLWDLKREPYIWSF